MTDLIKLCFVFFLIIFLLGRKIKLGYVMLIGAVVL